MRHLLHQPRTQEALATGVGTPPAPVYVREPAHQAFTILRVGFAALPIIAGLDKFFHLLTNWNQYASPALFSAVGGHIAGFMDFVGVVEIAAGILVAARPRWGSAIVGLWLCGIIINLLLLGGFYDIALRDFGLAVGALAFFRLSGQYDRRGPVRRTAV